MMRLPRKTMIALSVAIQACDGTPGPANGGQSVVFRVEVVPSEVVLQPSQTRKLTARTYGQANQLLEGLTVSWTSGNPPVASVDASGTVTAISSGVATVTATSAGRSGSANIIVMSEPPTGPVIDIVPTLTHQTMTGWEGVAQIGDLECRTPAYRTAVINRLINELGINRVRLEIRSGTENPTDWFAQHVAGQIDRPTWRPHWYESINDNADAQSINPSGFKFSTVDFTIDSVVTPLRQALAARGERLFVNLNYVDFADTPFEHSSNPQEYAEFMLATFQHLQAKYGWVPDAVEVILEPDNTPNWRAATIGPAIVATGDRLKAAGFRPAFIAPSTTNMTSAVEYFDVMMSMPRVSEYLTDLSYHRYSGVSGATLSAIGARAQQLGIRTAMLEHIGSGHEDLHEDLTAGRNSSWQQFVLAFCGTQDGAGAYYLVDESNPVAPVVILGQESRYLRQYFLFVRLGAVRVGALTGDSRFSPVAFRNPSGKYVVVVKASAGSDFQVRFLPAGTYGVKYTTPSVFDSNLPDVTIGAGQTLSTAIPARGVITIYQR